MLSQDELLAWYQQLNATNGARSEVNRIRSSGPSRRVGGGSSNVSGRYPSRKMGFTIQFESHRVELAFVREMEHEPDVLEYYDQHPRFHWITKPPRAGVLESSTRPTSLS